MECFGGTSSQVGRQFSKTGLTCLVSSRQRLQWRNFVEALIQTLFRTIGSGRKILVRISIRFKVFVSYGYLRLRVRYRVVPIYRSKRERGGDLRCGYRNQFKGNIRCDEAVAAKSKSKGLTSSSERTLLTHLLTIEAGLITTITIGGLPLPTPWAPSVDGIE